MTKALGVDSCLGILWFLPSYFLPFYFLRWGPLGSSEYSFDPFRVPRSSRQTVKLDPRMLVGSTMCHADLQHLPQLLNGYWVKSLDFNFLGNNCVFPLDPHQPRLFHSNHLLNNPDDDYYVCHRHYYDKSYEHDCSHHGKDATFRGIHKHRRRVV